MSTNENAAGPIRRMPRIFRIAACAVLGPVALLAADAGESDESWWSLQPVVRPDVPEVPEVPAGGDDSGGNPIDRFLDAARRARGLTTVAPADKHALLRRVHLDLTGIPPSPAEQEAFLSDPSADAYEKVVDRLLDDEQHAVRYARHWLDVLRYSDADANMTAAPGMHLWREWVIHALHDDLPYDAFVQIQLTGRRADERTQMSATGYRSKKDPRPGDSFALGFLARGAGEHPQELALNAVDTISSAFMGMSVGCAKCHDHKSDPVTEVDYYAMKALFDPLTLRKVNLASAGELMAAGQAMAKREKVRAPLERSLAGLLDPFRQRLLDERVQMLPPDAQAIIRKPGPQRSVEEQKIADDYFPILRIDDGKIDEILPDDVRERSRELKRQLDDASRGLDIPSLPVYFAVEEDPVRALQKSFVLTSGDPERPELENEVQPGWPFAAGAPDFREGRIEAFADWLTSPGNPLFARVAVNRLWQWHFGVGLHRHSSDFGKQSGKPSHPELLDWLASEFVRQGHSMKKMHRLMVTSRAYRMASDSGPEHGANQKSDPENAALWHFPLRRLEAEAIWDSIHSATGRLDLAVGGKSFDPRGGARGRRREAENGNDAANASKRRGAYMIRGFATSRDVTPGFLQTFDVDDGRAPCPMRTQTVTAPQSLFLMNSPEIEDASAALAARLQADAGGDLEAAVERAYRLTVARPPAPDEKHQALAYLQNDTGRLKQLAWLLFNLDEFLYVR